MEKLISEIKKLLGDQGSMVAADRQVLWGLDFDGTLVQLHEDPDQVALSAQGWEVLKKLSKKFNVAIISGRGLDDLRAHVPLEGMHFVGNHGAQILERNGASWQWYSEAWARWCEANANELESLVEKHGGWIEDKNLSLTVHFRGASDERWWTTSGIRELEALLDGHADLMGGTLCWNVTPVGAPHKGHAASKICSETGCSALIYFGDELTDENVFRLKTPPLIGVKVGPGETAAQYRLAGPSEVIELLARFV